MDGANILRSIRLPWEGNCMYVRGRQRATPAADRQLGFVSCKSLWIQDLDPSVSPLASVSALLVLCTGVALT